MKTRPFILFLLFTGIIFQLSFSEEIDKKFSQKVKHIHFKIHTVDTHTDTPLNFFKSKKKLSERNKSGKVDFVRMKEGGLDSIFFAIFLNQGKRTPEAFAKVQQRTLDIFKFIHTSLKNNSDLAGLSLCPADAYKLEKQGKRSVFIGIENGYPLYEDLNLVKKYYDLGARYITLCHTRNNQICDSSTDKPEHNGLSDFGRKVVREMNRLGMIIDVSHISDKSFYDVIKLSSAPVIASHSCARALCDSPRNLNDKMLKALAENGGVIQVCFMTSYIKKITPDPKRQNALTALRKKFKNFESLSKEEQEMARKEWYRINEKYPGKLATVKDFVDHIDHIVKLIGIDYVGIGTDFDGGGALKDCFDVSQMPNVTYELVKRGYTEQEIKKIWGGNFMRVFNQIIEKSKQLQK
jgi:membrane dipeptidase